MKVEVAQRVAVIANEGSVRDQLVNALSDFGVTPIWMGNPAQSNPDDLALLKPNKVIVSLEPSIELELEPYMDFLSQPSVIVLYDDAETTGSLSGWDLNRWARHMAAKLLNKDILPRVSETMIVDDNVVSMASFVLDEAVPVHKTEKNLNTKLLENDVGPVENHSAWLDTENYGTSELDPNELDIAIEEINLRLNDKNQIEDKFESNYQQIKINGEHITQSNMGMSDDSSHSPSLQSEDFGAEHDLLLPNSTFGAVHESENQDHSSENEPNLHGKNHVVSDDLLPEMAPHKSSPASLMRVELAVQSEADYDLDFTKLANKAEQIPNYDLSKYELLDIDQEADGNGKTSDSNHSLQTQNSMFLIISGSGGTVTIRSLLANINENSTNIFVISHDIIASQLLKFRDQLQKISRIPILLPEDEEYLINGNVYLLNNAQSIQNTPLGYKCIIGECLDSFISQADANVQVVVVSGADLLLSQALIQVSSQLNNVHVQDPDDCYEPELARLLQNVGVPKLSFDILEQWFN